MSRALALCAALALLACDDAATPTQVIVLVDAERAVKDEASALRLRVEATTHTTRTLLDETRQAPLQWPYKLALVPQDGDAQRGYRVRAQALAGEDVISEALLISHYIEDEKRYVVLQLLAGCAPERCGSDLTCAASGCVSAYADPARFGRSPQDAPTSSEIAAPFDGGLEDAEVHDGALDSDARIDEMLDGGADADVIDRGAVAEVGAECDPASARACNARASVQPLICVGGVWVTNAACEDDERCDATQGPEQGTCKPVAEACEGEEHAVPFCAGDAVRTCIDLISSSDEACPSHATCVVADEGARCACEPEYRDVAGACVEKCAVDNGGCDTLTSCTNDDGAITCGTCPSDYGGTGVEGCEPLLRALDVSPGSLSPAFDARETAYEVVLPFAQASLELSASTDIDGASITLDGEPLIASGTSVLLDHGPNELEIEVTEPGHPSRTIALTVHRGALHEVLGKPTDDPDGAYVLYGYDVAIDGDTMLVGWYGHDVEVFERDEDGAWSKTGELQHTPPSMGTDSFGFAVALDGDTAIVGSPSELEAGGGYGAVHTFTRSGGTWSPGQVLRITEQGFLGGHVALSGDTLVATRAFGAGSSDMGGFLRIYVRSGETWSLQDELSLAPGDSYFPADIDLDGDVLVAGRIADGSSGGGAFGGGGVYVVERSGDSWGEPTLLRGANTIDGNELGHSVAVDGDTIVVGARYEGHSAIGVHAGAPTENDGARPHSGAVYVFRRGDGGWAQEAYIKARPRGDFDLFGSSIALEGDSLVVGAIFEDSEASGINGDAVDNSVENAGAAYLFERAGSAWSQVAYLKADVPHAQSEHGSHVAVSGDTVVVTDRTNEYMVSRKVFIYR